MHGNSRVAHFSDGVFAVAITLLVLDLRVPVTDGSLIGALADQWPRFAAFAVSFLLIGCIWVNHHTLFKTVSPDDRVLLYLNLALLFTIVVIPFSTSLFAEYLVRGGANSGTAGALFAGSMLLMGASLIAVYLRAQRGAAPHVRPHGREAVVQFLRVGIGPIVNVASIGLAFVSAPAVLILTAALTVYYVADHVTSPADSG